MVVFRELREAEEGTGIRGGFDVGREEIVECFVIAFRTVRAITLTISGRRGERAREE